MSEPTIKIELYSNKSSIDKGFQELVSNAKNKKQILRELSQSILDYIDDAFESEGKNIQGEKWQDWSQNYYDKVRKKIGGQILQLNGDLRKSIQRKVNDDINNIIINVGDWTGRGGWRGGGRKKGVKIKPETVVFYKRVTPEEKEKLEQYLNELRKQWYNNYYFIMTSI